MKIMRWTSGLMLALSLLLFCLPGFAQTGIEVTQLSAAETEFKNYLKSAGAPGGSLAISRNEKLIYARSFGHANIAKTENVTPNHLFRLASVSKSINSIALMKLLQNGQINLTDRVFGTNGILNDAYYYDGITVADTRWNDITVQQLLEHTTGMGTTNLTQRTGGTIHSSGLCNHVLEVADRLGEAHPGSDRSIIKFLLTQNLTNAPGTVREYNNSGFTILAQVIAKRGGGSLENYMKNNILNPLNIQDIKPGRSLYSQKLEREVEYATPYNYTPSIYNDNISVPNQYGGWSHEAALGAGGWIGSPKELVKLLNAVDGSTTRPEIINSTTRATMLTTSSVPDVNGNTGGYAKGWGVNSNGDFHHNGGADGTSAYWGCRANGICFAAVVNGSDAASGKIETAVNKVLDLVATSSIPAHDLFNTPTTNASNVSISTVTNTSAKISWTNGNGTKRLVLITPSNPVKNFPVDGTSYISNATYSSGSNLGSSHYVVYNGTGTSVTVTGLSSGKVYYVRVIEYIQNSTTGNKALYLLGGNPIAKINTTTTGNALPSPWVSSNIGSVASGSATYSYSSGSFNITASGSGITSTSDNFRYTYLPEKGKSSMIIRINSSSTINLGTTRVGIMYRESLNANAANVTLALIPNSNVHITSRSVSGGSTITNKMISGVSTPLWLRLDRFNNQFVAFTSTDGSNWKVVGTVNQTMGTSGHVGIVVTSALNSTAISTVISNVQSTISNTCNPVTGLSLATSVMTISNGATAQFSTTISPGTACNKGLIWTSSNIDVVTIDAKTGIMTPKANGISTIRVQTAEGNFSRTATVTVTNTATAYYKIKNRWTGDYIFDAGDQLQYSAGSTGDNYLWSLEYLSVSQVEIRNKATGDYIHIQDLQPHVQAMPRNSSLTGSRWTKSVNTDGFTLFNSVWKPGQRLSNNNLLGYIQHVGNSSTGWWSAQWTIEPQTTTARFGSEADVNEKNLNHDIVLFPNPASNYAGFNNEEPVVVEIIDISGSNLYKSTVGVKETISLENLNSGIYIYKINGKYSGKFSIVK